nr:M20/M25/M40 family metallo-hydrolase [Brevibacterium sp.]
MVAARELVGDFEPGALHTASGQLTVYPNSPVVVAEHSWDQNPYSEDGVELAWSVADDLGLNSAKVMVVAGHDSTNMKDEAPTVMLFIPSVDGISHSLQEFTKDEDLVLELHHLTEVVLRLAAGAVA